MTEFYVISLKYDLNFEFYRKLDNGCDFARLDDGQSKVGQSREELKKKKEIGLSGSSLCVNPSYQLPPYQIYKIIVIKFAKKIITYFRISFFEYQ